MADGRTRDVVVIGGGHNGLIAAAYLAKAGRDVLVLERRPLLGGAAVTEEVIPGFRASACSYVLGMLRPQVLNELELKKHGLVTYQTDVSNSMLYKDGRSLVLWKDLDRNLRELDKLHPGDAEGFVRLGAYMQRFAELMAPHIDGPAPTISELARDFERAGETTMFTDFMSASVYDVVSRFVEGEEVKGLFLFLAMVSTHWGPYTPGSAYVWGHHSWGEFEGQFGQYGFVRGGMSGLSEALASCARSYGAEIRTEAPVAEIEVKGGRAVGVVLEDGERIPANTVVSNADPYRTLVGLVPSSGLDAKTVDHVKRFDYRGSMARVFLALDKLPQFKGTPEGETPFHRGLGFLGADTQRFEAGWQAQKRGEFHDDPVIEYIVQTVHDPSLAPEGKHMVTMGIQQLPFELAEGDWDSRKEEFTNMVIDRFAEYCEGDLKSHIIDTATITPLDLEREYGLTGGNIFHGALTLGQLFDSRPLPGYRGYRTPIEGLFLCGSGTHPGGGVMGANGRNAARTILGEIDVPTAGRVRRHSVNDLLENPRMRSLAIKLAKQRWTRPIARLMTRQRR